MVEGFDAMKKSYDKSKTVVAKEGIPNFYIRALAEIEDFVKELWANKSKLNKINAKSLASLRQNFRKYIKDSNFEEKLEKFREVSSPHTVFGNWSYIHST